MFRRQMAWLIQASYQPVDLEANLAYITGVKELSEKFIRHR